MFLFNTKGTFPHTWTKFNPSPTLKTTLTLFQKNFIPVPTVLVRRSCLDQVGWFDESLSACEDYDLWLRIIEKWVVYQLDEPLVSYRQLENNMQKDKERMWVNWLRVKEKAFARNSLYQRLPFEYLDPSYYKGYLSLTRFYLDRNDSSSAEKVLHRYRQARGCNLSLKSFKSGKNTNNSELHKQL